MVKSLARTFIPVLVASLAACASQDSPSSATGGGSATVLISGTTFAVDDVELTFQPNADGFFRIEGNDAADKGDCLPGLPGGLALYGDLPDTTSSLQDLNGKELPFEFSGDGDDANLCFAGSNGLLGVETGTVKFTSVDAGKVTFSFSGRFKLYDGQGGESEALIDASGSGTAHVVP